VKKPMRIVFAGALLQPDSNTDNINVAIINEIIFFVILFFNLAYLLSLIF
jgi:hypothetical protein